MKKSIPQSNPIKQMRQIFYLPFIIQENDSILHVSG